MVRKDSVSLSVRSDEQTAILHCNEDDEDEEKESGKPLSFPNLVRKAHPEIVSFPNLVKMTRDNLAFEDRSSAKARRLLKYMPKRADTVQLEHQHTTVQHARASRGKADINLAFMTHGVHNRDNPLLNICQVLCTRDGACGMAKSPVVLIEAILYLLLKVFFMWILPALDVDLPDSSETDIEWYAGQILNLTVFALAMFLGVNVSRWWDMNEGGVGVMIMMNSNASIAMRLHVAFTNMRNSKKYRHNYEYQLTSIRRIKRIGRYLEIAFSLLFAGSATTRIWLGRAERAAFVH